MTSPGCRPRRFSGGIARDGWHVRQESPVWIDGVSMPEPDISVGRGTLRDYLEKRPTGADVGFLVEVSDSSLANESTDKLEAYAADRIACDRMVNIPGRRIEVYNDPTGPADGKATYRSRKDDGPEDELPVVLDGVEFGRVAVGDILPRAVGEVR